MGAGATGAQTEGSKQLRRGHARLRGRPAGSPSSASFPSLIRGSVTHAFVSGNDISVLARGGIHPARTHQESLAYSQRPAVLAREATFRARLPENSGVCSAGALGRGSAPLSPRGGCEHRKQRLPYRPPAAPVISG